MYSAAPVYSVITSQQTDTQTHIHTVNYLQCTSTEFLQFNPFSPTHFSDCGKN